MEKKIANKTSHSPDGLYWTIILFLMGIILIFDRISPNKLSVPTLYVLPTVMGIYLISSKYIYLKMNALSFLFIAIGFVTTNSDEVAYELINRSLAMIINLSCSFIALRSIKINRENKELELAFTAALESAPHGVLMVDIFGRILFSNAQIEKIFGHSKKDLINKSVDLLVPHENRPMHAGHRQSFMNSPTTRPMGKNRDLFGLKNNGEKVPVEIGLTPFISKNGPMVMSTIIDITERKKFEEKLQKSNEDLEKKNGELEEFVHSVSHDLKAPIVSISGFIGLIKNSKGNVEDEKIKKYIERISVNLQNMEDLIKDLLDLSRVSQEEIELENLDCSEIIKSAISELEVQISNSKAKITISAHLPIIYGKRKLLNQVFSNLISNAIKYKRDEIDPVIEIDCDNSSSEFTVISIKDNGIGIDTKYSTRVFKIFERLHPDKAEGTGVGLAIVKKVIERHHGKVWFEANPKGGTIFLVQIPKVLTTKRVD